MFYSLKDKLSRLHFNYSSRALLKTAPIELNPDSRLAILSLHQHKDMLMYLLAIKSFAAHIPIGAVHIINDGTLTRKDEILLRAHIPNVQIRPIQEVNTGTCPRGGCWERLLSIVELSRDWYVIQLDTDTLALGNLQEVADCVANNEAFSIGTWDGQTFESMLERQQVAQQLIAAKSHSHIQVIAEANFHLLQGFEQMRYVRGCAGFSGFSKGGMDRAFIERISSEMSAGLGARWNEWGTEQVMSNIVVANSPASRVLPHPKYCDCTKIRDGQTHFVHFIGACRFKQGVYARFARQVIAGLTSAARAGAGEA